MKKNVGKTDRILRTVIGLSIVAAGFFYGSWFGLIGAAILIPAVLGSDPVYDMVGVNTNKKA
ncbi:MAG: DUF2892 domain-containing protein [Saprospiraceae bacterium]|nr:DUF2892 domain-containing protein [Saprospiraceae bacterium]